MTGALSASDILSWSYTVSSVGTFSGNGGSVQIIGSVLASPTQITIAEPPVPPATGTTNELTFTGSYILSYSQSWDTISVNPLIYFALNIYAFGNNSGVSWGTDCAISKRALGDRDSRFDGRPRAIIGGFGDDWGRKHCHRRPGSPAPRKATPG